MDNNVNRWKGRRRKDFATAPQPSHKSETETKHTGTTTKTEAHTGLRVNTNTVTEDIHHASGANGFLTGEKNGDNNENYKTRTRKRITKELETDRL